MLANSILDRILQQRAQQYGAPVPVVTPPVVAPTVTAPPPLANPVPAVVTPPAPTVDPIMEKRKELLSLADQKFGANYGQKNIASSLLDDTINSILSEQRGGAQTYLDRGRARGMYNDVGYNAGRATLDSATQAGTSRLRDLGLGIIDKYRANADSIRDKAYGAASSYNGMGSISLDPYVEQGNEVISRANQNAGGDLRNAFGGTKLFDFSSLNNSAGQAQGALNFRDTDVVSALTNRRRSNSMSRGLGSQGAF